MDPDQQPLSIALACGGTGGHVFPGLATAEVLRARGHEVTLWMTGGALEQQVASGWTGPVEIVASQGFTGFSSRAVVGTVCRLWRASRICRRRMKRTRPDVLLAMGSYASVGPARAALSLKIPVVLHEANVVPGKAVAFLARRAARVAVSFEETHFYLRSAELQVTGMPLRRDIREASRVYPGPRYPASPWTLLVMGGSRGARQLNDLVVRALSGWPADAPPLHVLHLTGESDRDEVESRYQGLPVSCEVMAFHHDMAALYRRAHLAICRAGASTCAELAAFGLPALLVPYPYATRDHQRINAEALEKIGAADVIAESALDADWLAAYLQGFLKRPDRLRRMSRAARMRTPEYPASGLADAVEAVGREARQERALLA